MARTRWRSGMQSRRGLTSAPLGVCGLGSARVDRLDFRSEDTRRSDDAWKRASDTPARSCESPPLSEDHRPCDRHDGPGLRPLGRRLYAAALTKAQRDKLTPDDIIALMKKGNERFRLGQESPHDYLAQQKASAKGQYPASVILSCIDSRAPAETIMDLGIGDCFNARVAGNIANDDILGSMEFACKVAGAKVVLVMGHTVVRRDQGRDRQGAARKSHGAARQDPPRRGARPGTRANARRRTMNSWMRWRARMSS